MLPAHEVLTLAYARLEEADGNAAAALSQLEGLVAAKPTPLAYIHLMRLARRAEGAAAARAVFARARRASTCTWEVYAAAAQLEAQMGGGGAAAGGGEGGEGEGSAAEEGAVVASRILMLALERFAGDAGLALHCVRFLVERNDVTNARAVLERSLPSAACAASKELWGAFLELEMMFGSPQSVAAVEARRAEAHPELRVASLFELAAMHAYAGLWPADARTLDALAEPADGAAPPAEAAAASSSTMTVPNLAGCIEYTGQKIDLEAPLLPLQGGGGADGGGSFAPVVPYVIETFLEALPRRGVGAALPPPSSYDVQALVGRLQTLPDALSELPVAAAAFCGSLDSSAASSAAADVVNQRPGRDPFTARQRKARAEGFAA